MAPCLYIAVVAYSMMMFARWIRECFAAIRAGVWFVSGALEDKIVRALWCETQAIVTYWMLECVLRWNLVEKPCLQTGQVTGLRWKKMRRQSGREQV